MKKTHYSAIAAMSIVIANMIGTGVFTGLGYQLLSIQDFTAIVLLWIVGGFLSLCGAFVYAELGSMFPQSGGEYRYLSDILHPSLGFLSGWISCTIGFTAPLAMSGMAVGNYIKGSIGYGDPLLIGIISLLILTLIHSTNHSASGGFQSIFTILKVLVIIALIIAGFMFGTEDIHKFMPRINTIQQVFSEPFAISLIYVIFAYSGWNASAYIASEIKNPRKNLPISIIGGTIIVTILYVLINMMFLYTAPINELMVDISTMLPKELVVIAGSKFLPPSIVSISGLLIAFMLISSMSSMVVTGPRVLREMLFEYKLLKNVKSKDNIPVSSIWIQTIIALIMMITSTYDTLITFTTVLITIISSLTAIAVIYARFSLKHVERPFKMVGYPATPLLFLMINVWILYHITVSKPQDINIVLAILGLGLIVWGILQFRNKRLLKL